MQPDHHHDEDAGDAEERAWRAIVENYGDRPHLEDPPVRPPEPSPPATPGPGAPFGGRFGDPAAFVVPDEPVRPVGPAGAGSGPRDRGAADEDDDRFVPPEPPAVPRASPDRALAWVGVLGSPLVLLASLLASFTIPEWAAYLLVVGFVGGFVYLVARMPREPREPWDDGAQV